MIFSTTPLEGAWIIDNEPIEDYRGFFARSVCKKEFYMHGLNAEFVQQSVSFNKKKGTLRGLHYQKKPYEEDKLVRVTRGSIFDVIVDIRKESISYGKWFGIELSEYNNRQIYIPKGFCHGFQTLNDNTEVLYQMTTEFCPDSSRGIRWNNPDFNIDWPFLTHVEKEEYMSYADQNLPFWKL